MSGCGDNRPSHKIPARPDLNCRVTHPPRMTTPSPVIRRQLQGRWAEGLPDQFAGLLQFEAYRAPEHHCRALQGGNGHVAVTRIEQAADLAATRTHPLGHAFL
jgi:hypothetical protein